MDVTVRSGPLPARAASVLAAVRGVPWWAAVLIAFVLTLSGATLDFASNTTLGLVGWISTIAGTVLSTLAVRRDSIFTPMVQPPLVVAAAMVLAHVFTVDHRVLGIGLSLINAFPLMLVATAGALVLGGIRILAEPLRRRPSRSRALLT